MKKIKLHSETCYILYNIILSFAVAMVTAANFGVSMIVAPAYIISQKLGITFGQGEYIVQFILFIVVCIVMKKVKLFYFTSFLTGLIYGAILDLWMVIIPHLNPTLYTPEMLPFALRIFYFAAGTTLTSLSIALVFKSYFPPQVYDFFVKAISAKFHFDRTKTKYIFDSVCLIVSCVMTFLLFGRLVGVGIGTLIMTVINGPTIGFFGKVIDRYFEVEPLSESLSKKFELN